MRKSNGWKESDGRTKERELNVRELYLQEIITKQKNRTEREREKNYKYWKNK